MSAQFLIDIDQLDSLIERSRVLAMLVGAVTAGYALTRESDREAAVMELSALIEESAAQAKMLTAAL
jgi:hypothetical protein